MNVQLLSDQQLLNSYLSGDQSAISQLIEKHRRRVTDYIRMLVKDRDVADDIFQDTFIKVIRTIDSGRYVENGRFLSWVLRIAHNQVIDHFRQLKQSGKVTEAVGTYLIEDDTISLFFYYFQPGIIKHNITHFIFKPYPVCVCAGKNSSCAASF